MMILKAIQQHKGEKVHIVMSGEGKQRRKAHTRHDPVLPTHSYVDLHVCFDEKTGKYMTCFLRGRRLGDVYFLHFSKFSTMDF